MTLGPGSSEELCVHGTLGVCSILAPSHPLSSEVLEVSHLLRKRPTESRDCTLKEASRFSSACLCLVMV